MSRTVSVQISVSVQLDDARSYSAAQPIPTQIVPMERGEHDYKPAHYRVSYVPAEPGLHRIVVSVGGEALRSFPRTYVRQSDSFSPIRTAADSPMRYRHSYYGAESIACRTTVTVHHACAIECSCIVFPRSLRPPRCTITSASSDANGGKVTWAYPSALTQCDSTLH
jgi:hypothetical protein